MQLALMLAALGIALAAPFVVAIWRSATAGRALRIWLVQIATAVALWGISALVFRAFPPGSNGRLLAAVIANMLWVGLALALLLGAIATAIRAIRLQTIGK
jgi:hypothetical protein